MRKKCKVLEHIADLALLSSYADLKTRIKKRFTANRDPSRIWGYESSDAI